MDNVTSCNNTEELPWDIRRPFKNPDAVDIILEDESRHRVPIYFDIPYEVHNEEPIKKLIGDEPFTRMLQNYPVDDNESSKWYNENKNRLDKIRAITLIRSEGCSLILKIDWWSQWHDTEYFNVWHYQTKDGESDTFADNYQGYRQEISDFAKNLIVDTKATLHEKFIQANIEEWSKAISFYSEAIRVNNAILKGSFTDFHTYYWYENWLKDPATGKKKYI